MKYKVGDLIKIVKSSGSGECYEIAGLVIKKYMSIPKIILNNPGENRRWLAEEGIKTCIVYDILYMGIIEEAILPEWIERW